MNGEIISMTDIESTNAFLKDGDKGWANAWVLTALVAVFFWVLELRHNYYFLQDDNRVYYIGALAHNWRAVREGGLALFNFHQFLGVPFLAIGQTATLYPPAYIAAGLSELFFGHIFAALDIYVILHLVAAGPAMFYFLQKTGVGRRAAFLGGLAWALNGFAVYMSANWMIVCQAGAYFPLMLAFSLLVLDDGGGGREVYFLAAARLGLFYTGYPQYFIQCVFFELAYVLSVWFFGGEKPERPALLRYLLSYALTAALSLPLLLPMWYLAQISADRGAPLPYAEFSSDPNNLLLWLQGLALPVPALWMLKNWIPRFLCPCASRELLLPCYAAVGWVMAFFAGWLVAARRFFTAVPRQKAAAIVLVVALAWSLGLFNRLLYIMPVLNRFRTNFKLVLFVNFALITLGATGYRAYEERSARKAYFFPAALILSLGWFAFLYMALPVRTFTHFTETLPLHAPLAGPDTSGRIVALTPRKSDVTDGVIITRRDDLRLVAFNYATLWGYDGFAGYQALVPRRNSKMTFALNDASIVPLNTNEFSMLLPYFRCWGVRRYIMQTAARPFYEKTFADSGIKFESGDAAYAVFVDPGARPPVYFAATGEVLEYKFSVNGVGISKDGPASTVVINALYNPFFDAAINGAPARIVPTKDGQISLSLPPGHADAKIYYRDPWFEIGLVVSGLALLCLAGFALSRRHTIAD